PGPSYGQAVAPPGPAVARRSGGAWKWWLIGGVAAVLALVITAGVVGWVLVARANSDEAKIQRLAGDFAAAVDRDDQGKILSLLCAAEAADITEDDDYDPAEGGPVVSPGPTRPVKTSDITVTGDAASARVSRPGQPDTTLHFRKESGHWRVCDPSGEGSGATPTPTG
ncbi:hypothetical protein ACFQ0D_02365, partial [Micromonospora zhanjiangensis]